MVVQGVSFGARVLALRKAKGWTQDDLARRSGLTRAEICKIEKGWNKATSERVRDAIRRGFMEDKMRAEIVELKDGGRVVVGRVKSGSGMKEFIVEIHRPQDEGFKVMFTLLSREEFEDLSKAVDAIRKGQ